MTINTLENFTIIDKADIYNIVILRYRKIGKNSQFVVK